MAIDTGLLNRYCREAKGQPDGWRWFGVSVAPEKAPDGFCKVDGAVGENWRKRVRGSETTFFVSIADFDAWRERTAAVENRCLKCFGEGKVWAGWSRDEGTKYRPCASCNGTGKPTEVCEVTP